MNKSDYIRLNLKEVAELPKMLTEKSLEFFNIEISDLSLRVHFREDVSCSHNAPIGKKTNWGGWESNEPRCYPGWYGQIYCKLTDQKINENYYRRSAAEVLFCKYTDIGFNGFHTGTGCPGCPSGTYPMNIGFYFFLDDFPLLSHNYKQWRSLVNFEKEKNIWKNGKLKTGQFIDKDWIY